jgi:hypothetical protein
MELFEAFVILVAVARVTHLVIGWIGWMWAGITLAFALELVLLVYAIIAMKASRAKK